MSELSIVFRLAVPLVPDIGQIPYLLPPPFPQYIIVMTCNFTENILTTSIYTAITT
jgi:hypothetical protein